MIKRIIFDIDNTLIPWKNEYYEEIQKELTNLNIQYTKQDYEKIKEALSEYENVYYKFNKELMLEYINKYTEKDYPKEFMYNILERWSNCVPEKIDYAIKETLSYLKNKYEMVILTDWYAEEQTRRLEKLEIKKYFSYVYSAEKTNRKPYKESFIKAIGQNIPQECVMIGDNMERDIKGALNAGLKAIYFNPKEQINITETTLNSEYITISNLKQLKELL